MNIFLPILPELSIFISAVLLLIVGLFVKNIKLIINLAIITLIIAIILVFVQPVQSVFNNSLTIDEFSKIAKTLILIGSLASIVMYHSSREDLNINLFEYPILILLATIGMMIMVSANDLIAIFIGLDTPVVKSHGSTDSLGFYHSINLCYNIVKGNLMSQIKHNLSHLNDTKR